MIAGTVELQWLEHLWDYRNSHGKRAIDVRATEVSVYMSSRILGTILCIRMNAGILMQTERKGCLIQLRAHGKNDGQRENFNPLYTGRLFRCSMLDESICHLGVSGLFCSFYCFSWKILSANTVDPIQTPHYVASDLGLHCLPMTLLRVSWYEWDNTCTYIASSIVGR